MYLYSGGAKPVCSFAGVLTPPPAPPAPAHAGFCTGKWYVCVVWWFDSCGANLHPLPPFVTAKGFDLHHRVPQRGKIIPRTPSRRRATLAATINTPMQCSNTSFEQWIFLPCKALQADLFQAEKRVLQKHQVLQHPLFLFICLQLDARRFFYSCLSAIFFEGI